MRQPVSIVDRIERMDKRYEKRKGVMEDKEHDYATEGDTFANFTRVHEMCKLLGINLQRSEVDVALFFVIHKLDRLCNLHNRQVDPLNESVTQNCLDLQNYIDIVQDLQESK